MSGRDDGRGPVLLRDVRLQPHARVLARPRPPESAPVSPHLPARRSVPAVTAAVVALPEAVFEEARSRGFDEGRAEGLKQGLAEAGERIDEAVRAAQGEVRARGEREAAEAASRQAERRRQFEAITESLRVAGREHLAQLEREAVELAFEVNCRLLGDSSDRRAVIESLVARAMAQLGGRALRVRVSAADLALIEDTRAAGGPVQPGAIEWLADERVANGGCLIDGPAGTLDARLDVQLRRLLAAWHDSGLLQGAPTGTAL